MDSTNTQGTSEFRFTFKPVEQSQRALIHSWLAQKHISEWLHGDGLRNTYKGLDEFLAGSSWGEHWIAYDNDTPFAYLLTSNEGKDAATLDLFICDLNYLGKGIAVQMIKEFLLSKFPNKKQVLIDPEATNTRAIHVYEKVGFYKIGEFIAKWHPVPHIQMRLDMKELINN
jgi:RimJ/RimL family protein N-acetyltransferase